MPGERQEKKKPYRDSSPAPAPLDSLCLFSGQPRPDPFRSECRGLYLKIGMTIIHKNPTAERFFLLNWRKGKRLRPG